MGGLGREIYGYLKDDQQRGFLSKNIEILGLDDAYPENLEKNIRHIWVGNLLDFQSKENDFILIAVGDPLNRNKIYNIFSNKQVKFFTYVHSTAFVADSSRLGEGTIICPFSLVNDNVNLDINCLVNVHCSIGHDSKLGRHSVLSPYVSISGGCIVSEGLLAGSKSLLMPKIKVGKNCKIFPGTCVSMNVKCGTTVFSSTNPKMIPNFLKYDEKL